LISKELNYYGQCVAGCGEKDMVQALNAYVMINSNHIPSMAAKFVDSLLSRDGKNRKTVPDDYFGDPVAVDTGDSVDDYYIKAFILVMNEFLNDQRESIYYPMYSQTVSLFLISKGLKDYVDQLDLPDDIRNKTGAVLIELEDRLNGLVIEAKKKCKELQPELYDQFLDLGVNLLNEATTTVKYRWFMDQETGTCKLSEEMITILQNLRAEYLRIVKRNGEVEVGLLLELFGMNSTTYVRYRKDMISKVAAKCDSSLISYIKYLFLNKDN
jgi:hypothetical protein